MSEQQPSLFPDPAETQAQDRAAPTDDDKRGRGRPSVLTPKVQERIVLALRAGAFLDTAAAWAGVARQSVNNWIRRGRAERLRLEESPRARLRAEEAPYVDFLDAIERAQADSELFHVDNIRKAAKGGDWKASAYMLEKKYPDRWGKQAQVVVTGPNNGPVNTNAASSHTIRVEGLSLEDLLALDAIAAKAEAHSAGQAAPPAGGPSSGAALTTPTALTPADEGDADP